MLQTYILDVQFTTKNDGWCIIKHFFKITHDRTLYRNEIAFSNFMLPVTYKNILAKILHP